MSIVNFLSEYRLYIFIVVVVVLIISRKKIVGFLKRKKKEIDYAPIMDNGKSFDSEFDFNKSSGEERDKYQKKLDDINKELESIKIEQGRVDSEYNKKKIMLMHQERQLGLQYNTYLNNLKNLDKMIADQEQMEAELG